jgi:hypothetical protein
MNNATKQSLQQLHQLTLSSGEIEIDESLFGGRKRGGKRGWGSIELSTKISFLVSTREMVLLLHFQYRIDNIKHYSFNTTTYKKRFTMLYR